MATPEPDPMENVERRRVQLEENVSKLRQALTHWQTWEFEYEMLKEEIQSNHVPPSSSKILEIGREMRGTLVNEKEVQDLLGKEGQPKRSANQVTDIISRRIDYVQQNIATAEKQLDAAEKKLAGASMLLEPDTENEEGLPLMDIQEELDENGNVVSSSVFNPGKSAPEIVEALRKAGVQKAEMDKSTGLTAASDESSSNVKPSASARGTVATNPVIGSPPSEPSSSAPQSSLSKKSVSFSEDTKPDPAARQLSKLEATGYNDDLADYNWTSGTKVIEVDEDDNEIASYPVIPQGESAEDAELRRQMLQYGLSEVGQVVAEMNLDQRDQEYSDEDDDMGDYDDEDDSDESETEDKYGRSLSRGVSDDYKQQMMDLEKKLNARMLENVGPRPDAHPLAEYSDDVRTIQVRKDDEFQEPIVASADAPAAVKPTKKGVRFADSLDVSPAPQPIKDPLETGKQATTSTSTLSDTIVERTGASSKPSTTTPSKPAKVSRFKSARTGSTQPVFKPLPSPQVPEPQPFPEGPKGRTLANTIVEHDHSFSEVPPPDEFDSAIINREVQQQYHKMRNSMIQQQGGFAATQEDEEKGPIMEEENGKSKKVSRFKAARLKADGAL
jgi:unconventional prefoldin RPB5 interactor 1